MPYLVLSHLLCFWAELCVWFGCSVQFEDGGIYLACGPEKIDKTKCMPRLCMSFACSCNTTCV